LSSKHNHSRTGTAGRESRYPVTSPVRQPLLTETSPREGSTRPGGEGEGKGCSWRALPRPREVVGGAGGLPRFRDSQHLASRSARLLGPAAKCHRPCLCTWPGRGCGVPGEARRCWALPHGTQVLAQTLAQPLAGGRVQTHVLTVLR